MAMKELIRSLEIHIFNNSWKPNVIFSIVEKIKTFETFETNISSSYHHISRISLINEGFNSLIIKDFCEFSLNELEICV